MPDGRVNHRYLSEEVQSAYSTDTADKTNIIISFQVIEIIPSKQL